MGLWFLEIIAIVFVGLGGVMVVTDPGNWMTALASIVFFGLCAIFFTRMLILRRATK